MTSEHLCDKQLGVYFVMSKMSTVVSNVIGMYEDGYTTIQIATELKLPIITVENIVSCIWDYEESV